MNSGGGGGHLALPVRPAIAISALQSQYVVKAGLAGWQARAALLSGILRILMVSHDVGTRSARIFFGEAGIT